MSLAFENFQQGSVQFSTFGGAGSISSATGGHPITTSGTDRWIVWIFMTGRSQTPGNHTFSPVVTLTASGLTPVHLYSETFNPTVPGNDPSFPEGNMAVDVWIAPAASQLTSQAWSTVTGDTFVNNQVCFQFAISGLPDITDVDSITPIITFDFSGSSTHPESDGVSTSQEAAVLALFCMKNGGFTQNAEPGYTLANQDAGGHSSSNWKCWLHRLVESSAITNKVIGDSSGSTSYWWSIVMAFGSPDTSGDGNASGVTVTDTITLSTVGVADAYVPQAGSTITVNASLIPGEAKAQAIDGTKIYEVVLGIEASSIYQTSDYDSIWGRGERVVNGLIDVGFYGFDTVGFWDSAFNDRFGIGPGDGPTISGTFTPGDALWFEFNGGQKIDLRGFKLVGSEDIATDWFFKFVGGLSAGVIETDSYGKEFDTAARQQGPDDDPLTSSVVSVEYPTTPRIFVPYSHYEFVYDSGTQSTSRFCNEIWLKVAHSNLDGGDRRPTNGQPAKQVAFTMSSDWSSAGDPQDLLFDGVARVPGISKSTATIGTAANSNNPVSTVGAYFQFVFPRPVIMNHFMLVTQGNVEDYDSGDLPVHYGTWHWEYSLNSGSTWTPIGDPWSFSPDVQWMVAPRDGSEFALGPIGTDGKGASHWRMVLDAGPALGSGNTLWQIMFDLIDVTGQAPPISIAFTDGTDDTLTATPTIGGPGSPYVIGFTDGTDDKLTATVVNTPNAVLTIAFDDGASFDTVSDLYPSAVVQTIVIATGRR